MIVDFVLPLPHYYNVFDINKTILVSNISLDIYQLLFSDEVRVFVCSFELRRVELIVFLVYQPSYYSRFQLVVILIGYYYVVIIFQPN